MSFPAPAMSCSLFLAGPSLSGGRQQDPPSNPPGREPRPNPRQTKLSPESTIRPQTTQTTIPYIFIIFVRISWCFLKVPKNHGQSLGHFQFCFSSSNEPKKRASAMTSRRAHEDRPLHTTGLPLEDGADTGSHFRVDKELQDRWTQLKANQYFSKSI